MARNPMNRWLVVLGAVLIQLCLGAIYAWSVFTPALQKSGWSNTQTQVVFAVGLAVFAIVMVWAGKKLAVWGPRKLAMAGGLVLGAGYVMAGLFGRVPGTNQDASDFLFAISGPGGHQSFGALLICIGIIGGAGIGLAYVVPIAVGMRWFPDKKGMITGLAVAGFGFGALGWVKFAGAWGHLIANFGLSATFIIYGIVFAVLVVAGSLWMVYPPEGWTPPGYSPPQAQTGQAPPAGSVDWEGVEILRTPQFYLIFFTFVFSAGAGLMTIGLMKLYPMQALQAAGLTQAQASGVAGTAMAVFFSLANGIGRIAWGTLSDKLGRKLSVVLMAGSQGAIVILFTFMAGNEFLLYLGATLIGFNFGGNFALFPTITADTFGAKNVGVNYPLVFLSYGVGGIFGPILGGQLGDIGNFPLAFTICGGLCIIGAVLTGLVKPPVKT